ncbi:cytochrome C1 heme lyase [Crepidotus variabilis]|uniref:Holocytochrome c-type synthase n=1 Tax=Crepidotus variabilis TaxID=179855 RepID=A0A9P6EP56_9AGAR|nr:cytochrome C1 heme lyase [Crepidotus variabilis]
MSSASACPVDHSASSSSTSCPVDHSAPKSGSTSPSQGSEACPVDHTTRSNWSRFLSSEPSGSAHPTVPLSQDREMSSIPKKADGNWVYPSESQFFSAMARKNHNPQAADMKTIVPIHNAVNERAWGEILKWEAGKGGDACGGVKLVNFQGRPRDRTPKATMNILLGYSAPFDRHDWVVERCGTQVRYIIDFYTGKKAGPNGSDISFYLDVRPALDNWEGVKLRAEGLWKSWFS